MKFIDASVTTGAVPGSGVHAAGIGAVAFTGKAKAAGTPDEARVNRGGKQGRIIKVAPVAPPKFFNAGSVFERTSMLLSPTVGDGEAMAFVNGPQGKPLRLRGLCAKVVRPGQVRPGDEVVVVRPPAQPGE